MVVATPGPWIRINNFATSENYIFAGSTSKIYKKHKDTTTWHNIDLSTP
jgi:hypothetical protein